jgi:hypothetical protein
MLGMKTEQADRYLDEIMSQTQEVLGTKAKMYIRNGDHMHNFNQGALIKNCLREEVLADFRLKHLISVQDIINDLKRGIYPSKELVLEKYGDIINYYILELMSMLHRIEENEQNKSNRND